MAVEYSVPYLSELTTEDVDCFQNTLVALYPTHAILRDKILQKLIIWIMAYLYKDDPTFWNKNYPGKFQ